MVMHHSDMALCLVDERDDPTRLGELLRGPARLFPWLSRWLVDLLSRRVAKGRDEEARQASSANSPQWANRRRRCAKGSRYC